MEAPSHEQDPSPQTCLTCGHTYALHHTFGCDGNLAAERLFWSELENSPGYDQTREAILDHEQAQPMPCPCSARAFTP